MKWTQHPQSFLIILFSSPYFSCIDYRNSLPKFPKGNPIHSLFPCLFFSSAKEKAADVWKLAWDYQLDLGVIGVDLTVTDKGMEFSCCT